MVTIKLERERHSLQAIRNHWLRRRWPLEQPDGANAFIDSLSDLFESPLCWDIDGKHFTGLEITKQIDELENAYFSAMGPWERLKTVRDCPNSTHELRWPYGTYPAKVQENARLRFWELVSTTRFSVNEVLSMPALVQVNYPNYPVTIQHVAGLAAMVCIFEAINALESILKRWREISEIYREGKSFEWLSFHDVAELELILQAILRAPGEADFYQNQIKDARKANDHANAWLVQVENLQPAIDEIHKVNRRFDALITENKRSKLEKKEQSRAAAKMPRGKAKNLTAQQVADYWNAQPKETAEVLAENLAKLFDVSTRTVFNRLEAARKNNLVQERRCCSDTKSASKHTESQINFQRLL